MRRRLGLAVLLMLAVGLPLPKGAEAQLIVALSDGFQWENAPEVEPCENESGEIVADCKRYVLNVRKQQPVRPEFDYLLEYPGIEPREIVHVILMDWETNQVIEVVDRRKRTSKHWTIQLNENRRFYEKWKRQPVKLENVTYFLRWKLPHEEDELDLESEPFQLKVID